MLNDNEHNVISSVLLIPRVVWMVYMCNFSTILICKMTSILLWTRTLFIISLISLTEHLSQENILSSLYLRVIISLVDK